MRKKAFTLVELIVMIGILAILSTIAFVYVSGSLKEARDAKRMSDTSTLLSQIQLTASKGKNLADLIENTKTREAKILGKERTVQTFGVANFELLKENKTNLRDPSDQERDYPIAYAIGKIGEGKYQEAYKFLEIATILESEEKTMIKGTYYKKENDDSNSLFVTKDKYYYKNNDEELIYKPGIKIMMKS